MTGPAPQDVVRHPLGQHLHSLGVRKAAIIDDAYDEPSRVNLDRGEIPDFWGAIERDDDLVAEVAAIDPAVADAETLSDKAIAALWARRNDGSELSRRAREHLFATAIQKLSDVEELEAHLRALSLDVERLGSGFDLPDPSIKLVFIDYFLGATPDSVKTAKLRAQKAYEEGAGEDRPFIVLMSSEAGVEQLKEQFRDESKIVAGLFDFVHKPVLKVAQRLYLKLATWALGLRERHDIQRFVDALDRSVAELSERFMSRVRALGVEDYAYVQKLKLQADGHPLGDYMLWLFGSLLPHLAFDGNQGVREQRASLDAMRFTELLPSHWKPSRELAETYRLAICEPSVDEVGPHPLDHTQPVPKRLPWLRLGDLFVNDNGEVLMVANAACAIAFAPGSDRDDPDRYVILVPGALTDADQGVTAENVTEPFKLPGDEGARKIIWNVKKPVYQTHGNITDWLRHGRFKRCARLRLPYALQLQQAYQAHQTRVGMPVAPPRFAAADLEMWFEGPDGKCARLGETVAEGVRLIDGGDGRKFVLSVDAVSALLAGVELVIARQRTKLGELLQSKPRQWESRAASVSEKIQNLQRLADSHENWRALMKEEADLPNEKSPAFLLKGVVHVWCGGDFNDSYGSRPPVCLNIRLKTLADSQRQTVSQPESTPTAAATPSVAPVTKEKHNE